MRLEMLAIVRRGTNADSRAPPPAGLAVDGGAQVVVAARITELLQHAPHEIGGQQLTDARMLDARRRRPAARPR